MVGAALGAPMGATNRNHKGKTALNPAGKLGF
jgi:hypothetical protein